MLDAAPLLAQTLAATRAVKLLVTSREALHVAAERVYPVPPLRLPDPTHLPHLSALSQYEAVALFIERAKAVVPDFEVTDETAPALAEICVRLDGLPRARARGRADGAALTRDHARAPGRLKLLTGGRRDARAAPDVDADARVVLRPVGTGRGLALRPARGVRR